MKCKILADIFKYIGIAFFAFGMMTDAYGVDYVIKSDKHWCPEIARTCPAGGFPPGVYLINEKGDLLARPTKEKGFTAAEVTEDQCSKLVPGVTCSPNFKVYAYKDPLQSVQWGIKKTKAPQAWNIFNESVVVAVIDTGTDCSHPDIKCTGGYDATGENKAGTDPNGHGTHVSGIACGQRGNSIGIAGASNCIVYPVRVLGSNGSGSIYNVVKGVKHIVDNNAAAIINMSLGSTYFSAPLCDTILDAKNKGIVVISAAGNSAENNDITPHYPANCSGSLSVGSIEIDGKRSGFSNYGESVHVWAPGGRIMSSFPGNTFRYLSGTSMATPFVAGIAALMKASGATAPQIYKRIEAEEVIDVRKVVNRCNMQPLKRCLRTCDKKKCRKNCKIKECKYVKGRV